MKTMQNHITHELRRENGQRVRITMRLSPEGYGLLSYHLPAVWTREKGKRTWVGAVDECAMRYPSQADRVAYHMKKVREIVTDAEIAEVGTALWEQLRP